MCLRHFRVMTGVGGTLLSEGTQDYWAKGTGWGPTALSYIPETSWNDTSLGKGLEASGGGASMFYPKPSWQSGPGVPNVNAQLVPDIAFAASWRHDPYLIVADGDPIAWGGTSAATPFFAGVISILNQYLVTTGAQARPGLGNVNPKLYQLAQTTKGVFHDITSGDNIIPCKPGTPDCTNGQYGYVT
jgi:subtilase family serine protease